MKEGATISFKHAGVPTSGQIINILPDGRARVKDADGYIYLVNLKKTPKDELPTKKELQKNENKPNKPQPMKYISRADAIVVAPT